MSGFQQSRAFTLLESCQNYLSGPCIVSTVPDQLKLKQIQQLKHSIKQTVTAMVALYQLKCDDLYWWFLRGRWCGKVSACASECRKAACKTCKCTLNHESIHHSAIQSWMDPDLSAEVMPS